MGNQTGIQLDLWKENHRGSLRAITRKNGTAYLYRWRQNGENHSINFPAGAQKEFIQAKVLEIEASMLRSKLGLEDHFERQRKNLISLKEIKGWYVDVAKSEGLAARTIYLRENAMKRLMRFAGEDCLAKNITRERLNDFKRELLQTCSPAGARNMLSKIQTVFKKSFYENKIGATPFVGFEYPRGRNDEQRPLLTPNEMLEISTLFVSEKMRLAWHIARFTGMRGNDILALNAKNFDREKNMIVFQSQKMQRFEQIPLHPQLMDYINDIPAAGKIFDYKYFGSLSIEFANKIRKLKGPDFTPAGTHTPRHSLGAYLRNEKKWQWADIQMFLCHHPNSVTHRYTHDNIEHLRPLVNELPFE